MGSCRQALEGQGDKRKCQGAIDGNWQIPWHKCSVWWHHRERTGFGTCGITRTKDCIAEKFTPHNYLYDRARLPRNIGRQQCICLNFFIFSKLSHSRKSWIFCCVFFFLLTTQRSVKPCQTELPTACLGLSWAAIPPDSWIIPSSGDMAATAPATEFKGRDC